MLSRGFNEQVKTESALTIKKNKCVVNVTKNYQCNLCLKTFTSLTGLQRHNQHHTGKYAYFCYKCRKGFVTKNNYDIHMRAHDGRGYPCEYCSRRFSKPQSLQYHLSEHTGQYRFTCSVCSKGFNVKSLFLNHTESHRE